jgi:hypothetical protein
MDRRTRPATRDYARELLSQIVDAGGGEGRSARSVIAERGVVKCPVAASVHLGPQAVASRTQTTELLFRAGLG